MAFILHREKAHQLRRRGLSISDIARRLKTSKSTVSYWCREIFLTSEQLRNLERKQRTLGLRALLKHAEHVRRARMVRVSQERLKGKEDLGSISRRDFFVIGLALYWGEGYKDSNNEVGFTNTNSHMIKAMMRWFKIFYGIAQKDFILRVSLNQAHASRVNKVLRFWSRQTGVPLNQFTRTSLLRVKSRKQYLNPEKYFGTLRFKVRRASSLKHRLLGAIAGLEKTL